MSAYRPGQLWQGRDGDYLFVTTTPGGIRFVTVRATPLTVEDIERAYAPLTLVRDVDAPAADPAVVELAAAVVDAFDTPDPDGPAAWVLHKEVLAQRAEYVRGAMHTLAGDRVRAAHVVTTIRRAPIEYPATYPTSDEQTRECP
jgi:hypothetical protein